MEPWLAVPAWMRTRLPRFSCMGGSKRVVCVARHCPCDCVPGLDPGGVTPGRQRPIYWGRVWRCWFVANLLWESWTSDLFVAPDHHLCRSVHADLAGPGVSLSEWWAGIVHHAQSATTSHQHSTSPNDDTGSGYCTGTAAGHRVC